MKISLQYFYFKKSAQFSSKILLSEQAFYAYSLTIRKLKEGGHAFCFIWHDFSIIIVSNKATSKTINATLFLTHAYNVFIMQLAKLCSMVRFAE